MGRLAPGRFFAAIGLPLLTLPLFAQETAGEAQIGFQQFYLANGSEQVANVSGLTLGFRQFVPNFGLVSGSLAPALSEGRFRTGDTYLQLSGLAWKGQHWTLNGGDFRLPGRLLETSFTNLFYPEIAGRGVWVEASHGGRAAGFFFGAETIMNAPRVPLRIQVPQTISGAYFRQKVGSRLLVGARLLRFSNDVDALRKMPFLYAGGYRTASGASVSVQSLYRIAGPLHWFAEAAWSGARVDGVHLGRRVPVSGMMGPIFETARLTFRANYVYQSSSYLPLLGYYAGDRRGSYGEARFRPVGWLELFGAASGYQNNLERDSTRPSLRSGGESAGVSARLPSLFTVSGQVSSLRLSSRLAAANPWEVTESQQRTVTVARAFRRHNLRLTVREFRQTSRTGFQRQRSGEVEEFFHLKRFTLGGGIRIQRLLANESKTSLYYRGSAQLRLGPLSAYTNFETGNDLANRTLFATSTIRTTVIGARLAVAAGWDFEMEAYRSSLVAELNPESIFVLQGQGVFVPGVLGGLNQWSVYFRLNKTLRWGKALPVPSLSRYGAELNPLKGQVEGYVTEKTMDGSKPVEGIPVTLDQARTVSTAADGRYHFDDVPEGVHSVGLALQELPADFDPGERREERVSVRPGRLSRGDLEVIRLCAVRGRVEAPAGVPVERILIRLLPTDRYTSPANSGEFFFYNLAEGDYELVLDESTLPQYGAMTSASRVPVAVRSAARSEAAVFSFELRVPGKPVRKVFEKK